MKKGLTSKEVVESRQKNGTNLLSEQKSESFWDKLKGNFGDPMIKILCVALIINVVFAVLGKAEWYESVGIALAVILATFVSTFSEYKNENAFQKLQEEASKINAKVYRNGTLTEIMVDDVVVDDIVVLQAGDKVPADGVIVEGSLKLDQAVLNGESEEARKSAVSADYVHNENDKIDFLDKHSVFRGTVVCSGNAEMAVTVVGDKSIYGKIAAELGSDEERDSPLKVKLQGLANGISKFGYIGGIAIAVAFMFQQIVIANGFDAAQIAEYCSDWTNILGALVEAVILAVTIIVMAVPEGLPLMIAIVSALNMSKMLKDNVLVRKIAGIETAGSLNILFSDKTGTITKGKLEAVVFSDGPANDYKELAAVPEKLRRILSISLSANTTAVVNDMGVVLGGNATERATLAFVGKSDVADAVRQVTVLPFNSTNKYSATEVKGELNTTLIKGAPEKILAKCKSYYDGNGIVQPLSSTEAVDSKINELAGRAIRVIAVATVDASLDVDSGTLPDGNFVFVGIIGIRDEVRPESVTAIEEVRHAGVQVVMITGDRMDTAVAIAKEAGLLKKDTDIVLTSDELQTISDEKLKSMLPDIRVISRALPSDKSRLVRVSQELNLVVGMTGDGVNDSPALKKADVGFAMGGGTEVAKEASEIVILDDNFNSIDKAILYGRTIFNSIRKFIIFQLTINVAAVLTSFVAPLFGIGHPLSITQILWINLVMDTLAALAFGGEPALNRFMNEKPKKRDEAIVSKYMWSQILTGAVLVFTVGMVYMLTNLILPLFRVGEGTVPANGYLLTGYFAFFIFAAVFNAFNARTEKFNLFDNISGNTGFLKILGIIVVVQLVMTYVGGVVLKSYGLTAAEWGIVLVSAFLIVPVDLIRKAVIKVFAKS